MTVEAGYNEGLDAFLRRETDTDELLRFGRAILYSIPRILPGVGLISLGIRDWKTRKKKSFPYYNIKKKEDLKVLGNYAIQLGWLAFFVLKAGVVYKSVQNLTNRTKEYNNTERIEIQKENNLEKTVNYYDI